MPSEVDIANLALTMLGAGRIISLTQDVKNAREISAVFELERDAELQAHNWKFAIRRAQLAALADPPSWGFQLQYQLPVDCARLLLATDSATQSFPGTMVAWYQQSSMADYAIEGDRILTDIGAPLYILYVAKGLTDVSKWHPQFIEAFACRLAMRCCEAIAMNSTKRQLAQGEYKAAIVEAVRLDALVRPPEPIPDDTWVLSRL